MIEKNIKELLEDVKAMVKSKVLTPTYEVKYDSYVCYVVREPNGKCMLHAGRVGTYPEKLQDSFVGLFLNEHMENYKIIGIYSIAEELKP